MKKRKSNARPGRIRAALMALMLLFTLSACSQDTLPSSETVAIPSSQQADDKTAPATDAEPSGPYTDGLATASAYGMNGEVPVTVRVENGRIVEIKIGENTETEQIGTKAIAALPEAVIEAQSPDVDTVSGATVTSKAILKALRIALGLENAEAQAPAATSADVIVVGAGLSGLVTASRAAELGAEVLLLEQSGATGGSSRYAGGYVSGACTKLQEAAGIKDSPELAYEDLGRIGGFENLNTALAWTHVQRAGELVDWITDCLGVSLSEPGYGAYTPTNVARVYETKTGGIAFADAARALLDRYIEEGNVTLLLNTKATELVVENGVVTGVIAGDTTYQAASVVLATGGYGYNEEWVSRYNFAHSRTSAPSTAIGTGYDMAESVGAAFRNMEYLPAYAGALDTDEDTYSLTVSADVSGWEGSLWVDINGKRLADEIGFTVAERQHAWEDAEENYVFILFTQEMKDSAETPLLNVDAQAGGWDRFETELSKGYCVFSGSTIEELAARAGIEPQGLSDTLAAYNSYAEAGEDLQFGRTENLIPFESEQYYAVRTVPYILLTKGGVEIDTTAAVLREDGSAVEGLYACGELIGGANLGGYGSHGGLAHATCFVWGTIAAESAVSRAMGQEMHVAGYSPLRDTIPE
ncbi:MAG: FAD-dependent oxidoreductase [Lachnospiraceae bacterium]|nr:FAD-dependent oxidoreductase [Lachnospiraceae bacterium]